MNSVIILPIYSFFENRNVFVLVYVLTHLGELEMVDV